MLRAGIDNLSMVLSGKNIFILGAAKFDGPYESTSYTIANHLAQHNQVFYIDYPFTWLDVVKLRNTPAFKLRRPHFSGKASGIIETSNPNLKIVILPPLPSINFIPEGQLYRRLLALTEGIIVKRLQKIIKAFNLADYIYINSFNVHYPGIARLLSPTLRVFHCVDPLVSEYDRRHGILSEEELLRDSDLVICTSKQLFLEKKKVNSHTYFVPNAADITLTARSRDPEQVIHASLRDIPKPIIGYFGNIEQRLDLNLLKELSELHRDKSFVFAGPINMELPGWFTTAPNIHLIGRIPYQELPAVLKGFDIALIPFRRDSYSSTIFPLKLFEYLGAGKPVIATDFNPDLQDFTGKTVHYCRDVKEFTASIQEILMHDSLADQKARLLVAAANTWEKRAAEFGALIHQHLTSTSLVHT